MWLKQKWLWSIASRNWINPYSIDVFLFNRAWMLFSEIFCPELIPPANSIRSTMVTKWGTTVRFACTGTKRFSDGFITKTVRCVEHGIWTPLVDNCQGMNGTYEFMASLQSENIHCQIVILPLQLITWIIYRLRFVITRMSAAMMTDMFRSILWCCPLWWTE